VDDRNEKIGRKIRDNELKKVPYMLIVGEKEQAEGKVSIRKQGGGEGGQLPVSEFAAGVVAEVKSQIEHSSY
jgi:threonyl-tRNA synthetase